MRSVVCDRERFSAGVAVKSRHMVEVGQAEQFALWCTV
jgi:hypothetical protein